MSELGKRVVVAAIAIPAVLACVYLGGWPLTGLCALFALLGAVEMGRLAAAADVHVSGPVTWVATPLLVVLAGRSESFAPFAPAALVVLAAVLFASAVEALRRGPDGRPLEGIAVTLLTVAYLGLPFAVVPLLGALATHRGWAGADLASAAGLLLIALPLVATWVGDAAAYFVGSAWGKRRLAPTISPNKSWEGFWAALVGAGAAGAAWASIAASVLPGIGVGVPVMTTVGIVIGVAAVIGDLFESLLKRQAGVKDSGALFPGHGGVLDRVDSLLLTVPVAYLALLALGANA